MPSESVAARLSRLFALDGGEQSAVGGVDGVGAGCDGRSHGLGALVGEPVGVALASVDGDRDLFGEGASAGDAAAGVGSPRSLLGLPEDRLTPFYLGEDELRACLPGPVEDEINRRAASSADEDDCLIDDLWLLWPGLLEAVAIDTRGRRPWRPRLQHHAISERQPDEVGQLAVRLWVARDDEERGVVSVDAHAAAA